MTAHTVVAYTEMKRRGSHSSSSKILSSKGSSLPAAAFEPVPQDPAGELSEEKERDEGRGWMDMFKGTWERVL